jgi:crotonobetainyl-CoA:carnitine CoA-transferase CaiB-like acyl-CoA transferase
MGEVTQEVWDRIEQLMVKFFMTHTKEELYREALKQNIMIYPVSTPQDIVENEQLKCRDYWVRIEHSELGDTITYPGVPVKASLTPMKLQRRAPLIGEHNAQVYGELGFSRDDLVMLAQRGVI